MGEVSAESVGRDRVDASCQVPVVHRPYDVGPGDVEDLVAALMPGEISQGRRAVLQHRSHRPIGDDNPLGQGFTQRPVLRTGGSRHDGPYLRVSAMHVGLGSQVKIPPGGHDASSRRWLQIEFDGISALTSPAVISAFEGLKDAGEAGGSRWSPFTAPWGTKTRRGSDTPGQIDVPEETATPPAVEPTPRQTTPATP